MRVFARVLDLRESLTPADHQTHRRYPFTVPEACARLTISVAYNPKHLDEAQSSTLAWSALRAQSERLAAMVGPVRADAWAKDVTRRAERVRIPNLLTISLDDESGAYRGAGHRQSPKQDLYVAADEASPGLIAGPLVSGEWTLVLSVHTLVSAHCSVSIAIGAEVPTSAPSASRRSA